MRISSAVFVILCLTLSTAVDHHKRASQESQEEDGPVGLFKDHEEGEVIMDQKDPRWANDPPKAKDTVFFRFLDKGNRNKGWKIVKFTDMPNRFDKMLKTKFIIHGYLDNSFNRHVNWTKREYFDKSEVNFFAMDWSKIADNKYYPSVLDCLKDVGDYAGKFLIYLIDKLGAHPNDIHLIGHHLGAHVAGIASRAVEKQGWGRVGRVTGLDPARDGFTYTGQGAEDWPFISFSPIRLSKNSAVFVDVIHATGGTYGIMEPIGHVDFYPNGGIAGHPGCKQYENMGFGMLPHTFGHSVGNYLTFFQVCAIDMICGLIMAYRGHNGPKYIQIDFPQKFTKVD